MGATAKCRLLAPLLAGIALAACLVPWQQAAAQTQPYPARPIRVVVPSAPGGGSDLTARLLAPRLGEYLRQQVVIDNRPGAGTAIGAEYVARAAPDGYTLLLGSTALVTTAATRRKLPFDTLRDFAPITLHVAMPNLLVAHPSLPVKSVKELIAFARSSGSDSWRLPARRAMS